MHPDSQDIWVNENMTDRIYRFIPNEERWVAYPIPLSGTYTRDMTFTADGQVCTSNNPVPAAALEGGVLHLICIQPIWQASGMVLRVSRRNTSKWVEVWFDSLLHAEIPRS